MLVTDTNFWIALEEERADGQLNGRAHVCLAEHRGEPIAISIITWGELATGFANHSDLAAYLHRVSVLPLKEHIAWEASRIERELRAQGLQLGENDNWIAATARVWGLRLVTNDRAFQRVPRLRVITF